MARVRVDAGVCGHVTQVKAARKGKRQVEIQIESTCADIRKLAEQIPEVDPYHELTCRRSGSTTILAAGLQCCAHAACPVPAGIVKAMEVAAGLALPCNVTIEVSEED